MLIHTLLLLTTLIISSKAFSSRIHVIRTHQLATNAPHSSQLFMNPPDSNTPTILTKSADDEQVKSNNEYDYYIELSPENFFDGTKPDSSWTMAFFNFRRQLGHIFNQGLQQAGIKKVEPYRPPTCLNLILSNQAVKDTEESRLKRGEKVDAHPVAQALYDLGCLFLDELFEDRPIQRFWFLETVARIPYFSYVSMLHLYESLGWWRNHELRKIHYAEEDNELHHLLIMESLGGNSLWSDRFLAYHAAIVYYWALILTYLGSPRVAYQFMELLEAHAVDTYGTFLIQNNDRLKNLPAPSVAMSYYQGGDLYLFDDFQMRKPGSRRPPCDTLYDVFENIKVDEGEHVKTMRACQDYAQLGKRLVSPHVEYAKPLNMDEKRKKWLEWSAEINKADNEKSP